MKWIVGIVVGFILLQQIAIVMLSCAASYWYFKADVLLESNNQLQQSYVDFYEFMQDFQEQHENIKITNQVGKGK